MCFSTARAKFITGSVAKLLERPEGGAAWLLGLREVPYPEAVEALCTLPGIGPKVNSLPGNAPLGQAVSG